MNYFSINKTTQDDVGFDDETYLSYAFWAGGSHATLSYMEHDEPSVGASVHVDSPCGLSVHLSVLRRSFSAGVQPWLPGWLLEWPEDVYWPRRFGWSLWFDRACFSLWERMGWDENDPWWERAFSWPKDEE